MLSIPGWEEEERAQQELQQLQQLQLPLHDVALCEEDARRILGDSSCGVEGGEEVEEGEEEEAMYTCEGETMYTGLHEEDVGKKEEEDIFDSTE